MAYRSCADSSGSEEECDADVIIDVEGALIRYLADDRLSDGLGLSFEDEQRYGVPDAEELDDEEDPGDIAYKLHNLDIQTGGHVEDVVEDEYRHPLQGKNLDHFMTVMQECGRPENDFDDARAMYASFARLSQQERALAVKAILFGTSAPAGNMNELGRDTDQSASIERSFEPQQSLMIYLMYRENQATILLQ